jgi:NNP family nitrate/nitrite transporter-like MFS transporter
MITKAKEPSVRFQALHPSTNVLVLSTLAFTILFAVWLMFGVLAIPIRKELHLTDTQVGWLTSVAILSGSIWRLNVGIWTDQFGGRRLMTGLLLLTSIPCYMVSRVHSFKGLIVCALLFGVAGNGFSLGIAWCAAWFPKNRQGFALGVFGAGNVGASVTKLVGPMLIAVIPATGFFGIVPGGWRFVPVLYSALLIVTAAATWFLTPSQDKLPGRDRPASDLLRPLREIRVWRFSLYYVAVFGAYVALSVWLPKYYVDVYQLKLSSAAFLTTLFIFPASLLRPLGGWLSDRVGARQLMYWVFGTMTLACLVLSLPNGHFIVVNDMHERRVLVTINIGVKFFTTLLVIIGISMGVGKAAVYKYIPQYFPRDVGAVGGLVGLLGALGGFFLPPLFAYGQKATGIPQTVFLILLIVVVASFTWLHITVSSILRQATPELTGQLERRTNDEINT